MKILAIITLVLVVLCFAYFIYRVSRILKNHVIGQETYKIEGTEKKELLILIGCVGALLAASAVSLFIANNGLMAPKLFPKLCVLHYFLVVLGAALFGSSLTFAIGAFMLFYYKPELDKKQKNFLKYAWSIALVILSLWMYTEGIANYISHYPLPSGFSTSDGVLYGQQMSSGGLQVKFYGVIIVSGALLCYGITDHETYKKFGKHGLIDTLFIVAFLFGIAGARLWYCLVLERGVNIFDIASGGLAVQGGALLGIAAGVTFMLLFRKYIDVRFMMDVAIPTILLAQVAGRWGNFFNQEVYGQITTADKLWYVPTIVRNNMWILNPEDGTIGYRVPLFFIEGVMNLFGYFFIRYILGKLCKCHIGLGYQASAYIAWYGLVRVLLEPLRNNSFEYNESFVTAFVMIGIGLTMALAFFLIHYFRMKKGLEDNHGDKIEKV